jgi:hypothetical protein
VKTLLKVVKMNRQRLAFWFNLLGSILLMTAYTLFVFQLIPNGAFCFVNIVGGLSMGASGYYSKLWPMIFMEAYFVSISIWGSFHHPS